MKTSFSKVIALLTCLLMMVVMVPSTAFAAIDYDHNGSTSTDEYYNLISKKDWDNAPGISESEIVLNNDNGDYRQVVYMMKADANNSYVDVIPTYAEMNTSQDNYQTQDMLTQATWIDQNYEGTVIGTMNCCLSWYSGYAADRVGEPLGFMMVNGEILFDPGNCGYEYGNVGFPTCVVINKDTDENGNPRPADIPKVEMPQIRTSADLDGWEYQVIPISSGYIVKDGVNQNKSSHTGGAPRSVVGITADGQVVMMENDGRQSPYSEGMNMYECAEVMLDAGCVFAANCDGGGSSTFVSKRPGEELKVNNTPSDGTLRPSTSGICFISTAPETDEFVKANISTDYNYYTPESEVKFEAVATNLVGKTVEMPEDVIWKLSDDSFGTISNDGVFKSNGKVGKVTAQIIHNGEVKGKKEISIVWPTDFYFNSAATSVPFGKTVSLEMTATYEGAESYVALKAEDIEFNLDEPSIGEIKGFNFTATSDEEIKVTTGTLKATINGLESSLVINLGKGSEVIFDFEKENAADAWFIYDYNVNHSSNTDNSHLEGLIETVTSETGKVHSGDKAIAVTTDYSDSQGNGWIQFRMGYEGEYLELKNAKKLGFWIWMPEEAYANEWDLHIRCIDANGVAQRLTPVLTDIGYCFNEQDEAGWRYFTTDISKYPVTYFGKHPDANVSTSLFYIQFYNYQQQWQSNDDVVNTQGKFTYFIDDITVEYSDAADDADAPTFGAMNIVDGNGSLSEMKGQTIKYNTFGAEVSVADVNKNNATGINKDSAKAYIDGKEVACNYSNGRLSVSDIKVADGLHSVKFVISDNMGNMNSIIRQVNVEANSKIPTVKLVSHDKELTNLPAGSVYYVDLVASNIETAKKIEVDLDLVNTFGWEIDNADVAEGFELSYDVEKYENVATITIEKKGNVSLKGEQTVASIPVRVWVPKIDRGTVKSSALKELYLTIKSNRGVLECADGSISTFTCEPMKVASEMWMNQWNAPAGFDGVTLHKHTPVILEDTEATCTTDGYTNRTFCEECKSVVEWGTREKATGHDYKDTDGILKCGCGEKYNGELDGKTYIEGAIANGWVEDTYYYVDGKALTGSHFMDGKMYTFDEKGKYDANYKYDGWYEIDDTVMYFISNKYLTGYQTISGDFYMFDENGMGYDGEYDFCGTTVKFDNAQSIEDDNVLLAGMCGDDIQYVIHQDGRMVVNGTGAMYDYSNVSYNPWYADYRYDVKSLYIGKDITSIGDRAFYNLWYLEKVTFEEGSKLKNIKLVGLALNNKMTELELPFGVQTIGDASFRECNKLQKIVIPSSVTSIVSNSFYKTSNVTLYVVEGSYAESYAKKYGLKYETYQEAERELASGACGENAKWSLTSRGTLTISGSGAMNDYETRTAPWQEYKSLIKKVVIDKDITYIGKFNFMQCTKLTEVVFEDGSQLETIGWGAFGYCSSLKTVTIPATVAALDAYAFYYCTGLENVAFEADSELTTIGMYAFWQDSAMKNFYVPDKVISIGENGFLGCKDTATFNVAEGTYSHNYFKDSKLELREAKVYDIASGECGEDVNWALSSTGTLIISGSGAMNDYETRTAPWQEYKSLIKKVVIDKDITYIGKFNFMQCTKLTEVVFEDGSQLETIGWGAFGYCSSLKTVTIPATVTAIKEFAFYYCDVLEEVNIEENSKLANIGMYAFWNATSLEKINYPSSVKIGENAFLATKVD